MGISFIIPVYNAEKTLKRCLDSIVNANKREIEVICINDGSTDNSLNILIEYSQKYNFIKYIDKENEGPFIARKLGVSLAKNDYVGFIDSDDWIESNMIMKLNESIENTKSDIILFQYINDFSDKDSMISKINLESKIYTKEEFKDYIYPLLMEDGVLNGLCNKVYKRELFDKNVNFNYTYGEDLIYQLDVFDKASSLFFINDSLYHYMHERVDSLSNAKQDVYLLCTMYKIRKKYQHKWQLGEQILLAPFLNLISMCLLTAIKCLDFHSIYIILKSKEIKDAVNKVPLINSKSQYLNFLYKLLRIWFH